MKRIANWIAFLVLLSVIAPHLRAQSTLTPNVSFQIPAYQQVNWQVPINFNFNILDQILGGYLTLQTGPTPVISHTSNWVTANTTPTTITNFVGGFSGQTIRLFCPSGDTFTTVSSSSATISLQQPFTCNSGVISLTLTLIGNVWTETGRGTAAGSGLPAGADGDVQTKSGGAFAGGTQLTALAQKSATNDAIVYASPNGSDSNDGFSWGTAKLTVLGAYNALPSAGGTIYVSGSTFNNTTAVHCTPTSGQGLGFANSLDPNFSSMPEVISGMYWVKASNNVSVVGVSGNQASQNAIQAPAVFLACGGNTSPAFQLSGVIGYSFQNLAVAYPRQSWILGVDSNGHRAPNPAGVTNVTLSNVYAQIYNSPGTSTFGPTIDIGSALWLHIYNSSVQGNTAAAATTTNRYAINMDTGADNGYCTLCYIENDNFIGGGGLRIGTNNGGTSDITVTDATLEGSTTTTPVVDLVGTSNTKLKVFGGNTSDASDNPCEVRINPAVTATNVTVTNTTGLLMTVCGPAQIVNVGPGGSPLNARLISTAGIGQAMVTPEAQGQSGLYDGTNIAQTDEVRRNFSPALDRFANTSAGALSTGWQLPANWSVANGTGTITPGTAPDKTSNAGYLTSSADAAGTGCNSNTESAVRFGFVSMTYSPGDYILLGGWIQQGSPAPFVNDFALELWNPSGNPTYQAIAGSGGGTGGSCLGINPPNYQNDGNWQWAWQLVKVTSTAGSFTGRFLAIYAANNPINVYMPTLVKVPASAFALTAAPTFSSASETGNVVTVTTSAAHHLTLSQPFVMSGCSVSGYNGSQVVTTTPSGTTFTYYDATGSLGTPTGCVITPGNDSEAADWALHYVPTSDDLPAGATDSTPRGVNVAFGGSGDNFHETMDHTALTANRTVTWPDRSGTPTFTFIPNTATSLGTPTAPANGCATPTTVSAPGLTTADVINVVANADISGVSGFGPGTNGGLYVQPYPTAGNVNFKVCNNTGSPLAPGSAITVNWNVLR